MFRVITPMPRGQTKKGKRFYCMGWAADFKNYKLFKENIISPLAATIHQN